LKWGYVPKISVLARERERERERQQGNVEGKERKKWQHIWWGGRMYNGRLSLLPPFVIMLVEVVEG
jgi:hypothetical protein